MCGKHAGSQLLYEKCYDNDLAFSTLVLAQLVREMLGKRGHFLQLFCLFVQEERGLLISNGFERL